MKTVCLKCNRPLSHHQRITMELVEQVRSAIYENPISGFRAPLSKLTIGQWIGHDPMMGEVKGWETPFGTTESEGVQ